MRTHIYNTIITTGTFIDRIVGLLTPHQCIACGLEGAVLCQECLTSAGDTIPSRCAGCHKIAKDYKTCPSCISWLQARHIYVATTYDSLYERLLQELKFECRKQAIVPIAAIMLPQLLTMSLSSDSILCALPTAPARIRTRGFDHTLLLCRELAAKSSIPAVKLLTRASNTRQVGANRRTRLSQLENEFIVMNKENVHGKHIIIVDDILTTGASVASSAKALKKAGAKSVSALVYAQKI